MVYNHDSIPRDVDCRENVRNTLDLWMKPQTPNIYTNYHHHHHHIIIIIIIIISLLCCHWTVHMVLSAGTATQLPPFILILSWTKNGTVHQSVSTACSWPLSAVRVGDIIIIIIIIILSSSSTMKQLERDLTSLTVLQQILYSKLYNMRWRLQCKIKGHINRIFLSFSNICPLHNHLTATQRPLVTVAVSLMTNDTNIAIIKWHYQPNDVRIWQHKHVTCHTHTHTTATSHTHTCMC